MNGRIALGLLLALSLQFVLQGLTDRYLSGISLGDAFVTQAVWGSVAALIAMTLGGFVARHRFMIPALILQAIVIAASFAILGKIAADQGGDGSFLSTAAANWRLIVLSVLATILGATAGERLASLSRRQSAT